MIKLGLLGAKGRMGNAVIKALADVDDMTIAALADTEDRPDIVFSLADVVIDFTSPGSTVHHSELAETHQTALVVGTTGLDDRSHAALDRAGRSVAVVQAGNFSLGVNVMAALVQEAAAKLSGYDIEILEMHHRHKVDAPSGTAELLGEAAAEGRGVTLTDVARRSRDGVIGARGASEIGFATLRGGSVIGEHSVIFAGMSERMTLSHKAENRGLFAEGALVAARFAATALAGRYDMRGVLGLRGD